MNAIDMMKLSDYGKTLAVDAAARYPDSCFAVYASDNTIFLRDATDSAPAGAELICVAQAWDKQVVQLRYRGAHSEWRKI